MNSKESNYSNFKSIINYIPTILNNNLESITFLSNKKSDGAVDKNQSKLLLFINLIILNLLYFIFYITFYGVNYMSFVLRKEEFYNLEKFNLLNFHIIQYNYLVVAT